MKPDKDAIAKEATRHMERLWPQRVNLTYRDHRFVVSMNRKLARKAAVTSDEIEVLRMLNTVDLGGNFTPKKLKALAEELLSIDTGFPVSSRGWCYLLEQRNLATKSQFDKVQRAVNECRKQGLLPVDFVAEEQARAFQGVESEMRISPEYELRDNLENVIDPYLHYVPDWWEGEKYYSQMLVEKVDLLTLFGPIAAQYHIPIANSKGWSSILQRAEYARRFKEAEQRGLQCVLFYCGDFDPDGLRISDTLRQNLADLVKVTWKSGETGYDPAKLRIIRFGLGFDFIQRHRFTWIDNLQTGGGMDLADRAHHNHDQPYVREYLKKYGARKCEANVLVTNRAAAEALVRQAIEKVLGKDAVARFREKNRAAGEHYKERYDGLLQRGGVVKPIKQLLAKLS